MLPIPYVVTKTLWNVPQLCVFEASTYVAIRHMGYLMCLPQDVVFLYHSTLQVYGPFVCILASCICSHWNFLFSFSRRGLTEEIQSLLFECPSGSECSDMDNSDEDYEEQPSSHASSDEDSLRSSDTEYSEVEESATVRNKIKNVWHRVKKDLPLNDGFPESKLIPRVTADEAKTPLSMFRKIVDEDLVEHLTFETNRYLVQKKLNESEASAKPGNSEVYRNNPIHVCSFLAVQTHVLVPFAASVTCCGLPDTQPI